MTDHPAIAAKCTKAQIALFEEIACDQFVSAHPKRLQALADKRLIELVEHTRADKLGKFTFEEPVVPLHLHAQWCAWCAENVEDETEAS
jgi:hypothetical protein